MINCIRAIPQHLERLRWAIYPFLYIHMLLFSPSVTTGRILMAHTVSAAVNRRDNIGTAEIKRHSASPLVITRHFVPIPRAMFFHSHHNDSFFCDISNLKTLYSGSSGKNYVTVRCRFLSRKLTDRSWDWTCEIYGGKNDQGTGCCRVTHASPSKES